MKQNEANNFLKQGVHLPNLETSGNKTKLAGQFYKEKETREVLVKSN